MTEHEEKCSPAMVSLREYVDIRLEAVQGAFDARLAAMEGARSFAYAAMEKRLEGMNEIRSALRDQGATFATRNELASIKNKYDEDIRMLRESRSLLEGKAAQGSVMVSLGIGIVALVVAIVTALLQWAK